MPRKSFSPWLPDPIALAIAAEDPGPVGREIIPGLLWIAGAIVFNVWAPRPTLLPFAAILFVHHTLHLGPRVRRRDAFGAALITLPFALASVEWASGHLRRTPFADWLPGVSAVGWLGAMFLAAFVEVQFRRHSLRHFRLQLVRLLGKVALAVAIVTCCLGAVLVAIGRVHPPTSWWIASAMGIAASIFILRAHRDSFRSLARPGEWRSARRGPDGALEEAPARATGPDVVTLVPPEHRSAAGPAYRGVDTSEPMVISAAVETLQTAVWDVEASLWSFVLATAPLTSAPMLAACIVGFR